MLAIQTEPTPLANDPDGVVRVGGTRVTLDTLVAAFADGLTPEEIVYEYPSLLLAEVYVVLGYYLRPNPILLPFHLLGEISRTIALAVRLFGNIMSLETAALLVLLVVGFLAPVPLLLLHIIEALVQAYIFGILALIYIAGAIQSQQLHKLE